MASLMVVPMALSANPIYRRSSARERKVRVKPRYSKYSRSWSSLEGDGGGGTF